MDKNPRTYSSDKELVAACLKGNQQAWNELVARYQRLVYSIPRRHGLSSSDADDVFQNVFTIVLKRLDSLQNRQSLAAWLITITARETWHLAARRHPAQELDERMVDDEELPPDQVQHWENQHVVWLSLDQLGGLCRELLIALFLTPDPASYAQIAHKLKIPVGSIGPTRARCFKKLEAILITMGYSPN
jgi:RNA polymerase sigma factor (sigma-70 family)